jgi:hypothetical protein
MLALSTIPCYPAVCVTLHWLLQARFARSSDRFPTERSPRWLPIDGPAAAICTTASTPCWAELPMENLEEPGAGLTL